ncbi:restriction endonuclease subunit S [Psychrobacter nivimaris]|uniref:restriction endonuclease subunit S n=1 Tax=Psychrobacter nivimaris TaxID=281738 RepID=UPI00191999AD|nr:restriction endonuclease subunit S [Psychrobacter nivimaris]
MVPNGWEFSKLGNVAELQRGFDLPSTKRIDGNIPIVSSSGVSGYHNEYKVEKPGIVTGRYGSIGNVYYVEENFWPLNTSLWVKNFHSNYPKFIYYLLSSFDFKKFSDKTGVPGVNRNDLHAVKVAVPPLLEQKKIVKILSTWDKAISTTERLIDNSTQQKKALMQQLLTGKKRLFNDEGKRFEGEWEEIKLGSLYSFKRGKGISKGQLTENGNKCVLYGELYTHYGEVIHEVKSRTREINSVKSIKGDVLIPASTTTTGIDLANATAVLEDDILLGGDINILRPKKATDAIFMAHLLTHIKKFEIARKGQGITIIHVYGKDLANLDVLTPKDLKEQQKIAIVLTNADKEIELLEQQLANFQQEKKALMQVLLTGKKRVVVDGEVI